MTAFKLTKKERADLSELASTLETARDNLQTFLADLHSDWQSTFDERSEKWQEGEAGQAASQWLEQMQEWIDKLGDMETIGDPDAITEA